MSTLIKNKVSKEGQAIKGVEKLTNARDLGGYVTRFDKRIKWGKIIRSSDLSKASLKDIEILRNKYCVSKIIDIRDYSEEKSSPNLKIKNTENIFIDMYRKCNDLSLPSFKNAFKNATGSIGDMIKLLEVKSIQDRVCVDFANDIDIQNKINYIFKILINNKKGSVLIHSKRGSTRAGIVSSLILYVLGVDLVTIFEDFQLSNEFYKEEIEYYKEKVAHLTDDKEAIKGVEIIDGTDMRFLEEAFLCIEAKWGSLDDYIRKAIGLSNREIQLLREKYLENY